MKKWERVIFHIDINHCYAQMEEMKCPELKEVAMAVGGNEKDRHGIILAKNNKAKEYGIKTGESLKEAYAKCPTLLVLPPHFEEYMYYSEKVKDIYREYSDRVESFGLDEAWIDFTASQNLFGDPISVAKTIQTRIQKEIGLNVSIGVSFNKVFAKLGSDMIKPNGFVVISKENFKDIVWKQPIQDLLYVGKATKRKLMNIGIQTIGDLAMFSKSYMVRNFGKIGEMIWSFANGYDISEVLFTYANRLPKSIGNGITTKRDLYTYEDAKLVFWVLIESVSSRLKEAQLKGYVIHIGLRNKNLEWITRQKTIHMATNIAEEIMEVVSSLLLQNYDFTIPLRSISISVSHLVKDTNEVQLTLFHDEEKRQKAKQVDVVMDSIRNKYGYNKIQRCAALLDPQLTSFNPKKDHIIHPEGYFK